MLKYDEHRPAMQGCVIENNTQSIHSEIDGDNLHSTNIEISATVWAFLNAAQQPPRLHKQIHTDPTSAIPIFTQLAHSDDSITKIAQ
eukprot:6223490-Pyramimonas_sp.AAC.1